MKRALVLATVTAAMLGGCATPQARIENRLIEAGFSKNNAHCLARELTDRLTMRELQTLNEVTKLRDQDRVGRMTIGELARRLERAGDPKLIVKVSRAGLGCAILC